MVLTLKRASAIRLLLVASLSASAPAAEHPDNHAIFKTTDRGRSWSRSDKGLPDKSRINAFGSSGDSIFAATDSGVFISQDEARTWQKAGGAAATSGRIISFASLGQVLYAGTDRHGLLVSPDNGRTWSRSPSFPGRNVRCLRSHAGKLYAGTDSDGVLVSRNNGQSWMRLKEGLPLQVQIFALSFVRDRLFAGLYAKGLYVWTEQGQRWTKVGSVSPLALASAGNALVAGHNPGGIQWSDDMGATWSHSKSSSGELSNDAPVWALASDDEITFAGAAGGIYFSEDRGRTWVRARKGLPIESPGVSFLFKGNLILAGTVLPDTRAMR